MLIIYFYITIVAFLICQVMVPIISRLAIKVELGIDRPSQHKIHQYEVPRLGGIAILSGFFISVLFFVEQESHALRGFLLGGVLIFLTGLIDDVIGLRPFQKLAGQIMGSLVAILIGGVQLSSLGNPLGTGEIQLGMLAVPVTLFAIVGVINAINLMDGLDGLAGGVSLIASFSFAILAYRIDNPLLLSLSTALCGALLGFLVYNIYPARIFMGDSGSLVLGYFLAVFSIMLVESDQGRISALTPLLILLIPVLDVLVVMVGRWKQKSKIFSADRTHLHYRLLDLNIGHRQTVLLIYGMSYICSFLAIIGHAKPDATLMMLIICVGGLQYLVLKQLQSTLKMESRNQSFMTYDFFRSIVVRSNFLFLLIKYLVITLMLLTVFTQPSLGWVKTASWGLLFVFMLCFILKGRSRDNALLGLVYLSVIVVVFRQVNFGTTVLFFENAYLMLCNACYAILGVAVLLKSFIRKRFGRLIDRPYEYFLLFLSLSVPLLPVELTQQWHLLSVVAKCILLFAAMKLILIRKTQGNRKILAAILTALLLTW